jgi:hypothetical protein
MARGWRSRKRNAPELKLDVVAPESSNHSRRSDGRPPLDPGSGSQLPLSRSQYYSSRDFAMLAASPSLEPCCPHERPLGLPPLGRRLLSGGTSCSAATPPSCMVERASDPVSSGTARRRQPPAETAVGWAPRVQRQARSRSVEPATASRPRRGWLRERHQLSGRGSTARRTVSIVLQLRVVAGAAKRSSMRPRCPIVFM